MIELTERMSDRVGRAMAYAIFGLLALLSGFLAVVLAVQAEPAAVIPAVVLAAIILSWRRDWAAWLRGLVPAVVMEIVVRLARAFIQLGKIALVVGICFGALIFVGKGFEWAGQHKEEIWSKWHELTRKDWTVQAKVAGAQCIEAHGNTMDNETWENCMLAHGFVPITAEAIRWLPENYEPVDEH
ncbi:hypothetical protein [Mesorhizobium sp.]|uniref:hypothetical protein n=1 Tax=Mesorhizobium sp. TaxID=1871066 RepID=UPI0025E99F1A|nr:hypothetical protein [Mesorhizobium sp.]